LATDGIYDVFFPYLLKDKNDGLYITLIRFFMDNNILKADENTISDIGKTRENYFNSDTCDTIIDDKTLVVLINGDVMPALKEKEYYAEPDWDTLQTEWNKKAYPHLYNKP
jgi:hypothetical protein